MRVHLFLKKLLILLFLTWFILALTRLCFNYIRAVTLEKKWIQYTDSQKRKEIYGDIYTVLQYINTYYPTESNMLLISRDGKEYFISRYILYPKKIYWDEIEKNESKKSVYSLIINFHPEETKKNYPKDFFDRLTKNKKRFAIKDGNNTIAIIYK